VFAAASPCSGWAVLDRLTLAIDREAELRNLVLQRLSGAGSADAGVESLASDRLHIPSATELSWIG